MAGSWLDESKKVAILSANKTLARQMAAEGEALGIPVSYMEGRGVDIPAAKRRSYQRAQAVGIMNYWVYFNQNPIIDNADLLIMDDAHLAEHCLHSLYSVEITRRRHPDLFRAIAGELYSNFPEYAVLADALSEEAPSGTPAELLSFIDQVRMESRLRDILDSHTSGSADNDLKYRWQRLRQSLTTINLYMSRDSLWLRPYAYPLVANQHYKDVEQAIYLSATVGDPSDLQRRLGVQKITKIPVPSGLSEATSGRRLIVLNRTNDEKDIPQRTQKALIEAIRSHPKSVWLCASESGASRFQDVVIAWLKTNGLDHPSWLLTSLGDEIDQFRAATKGHLFVGGRFDGMDFKGDECRIVVVTTLPRSINLQEDFITSYLRDSGFMRHRLNQRIVQALGRCNRSDNDFGVYFLADQRFATHFSREANRVGIPRNMTAEIDLAQELAEQTDAKIATTVKSFLMGNFEDFDKSLSETKCLLPSPRAINQMPETANDEVIGWAAMFDSKNFRVAEERFERCWDATKQAGQFEICALHGWHWAKALYLAGNLGDHGRKLRALEVLDQAIARGGASSWFNRMRASILRTRTDSNLNSSSVSNEYAEVLLRSFDEFLEKVGTQGDRFQRQLDKVLKALNSSSHAEFQEGLEMLGKLLGFSASRPKYETSTDCRWRGVFGNIREIATFEAKIEHEKASSISATDVGQAHNQSARAKREFEDAGYSIRSVIVTHLDSIQPNAKPSLGAIRILPKDAVTLLFEKARLLLTEYRSSWSLEDIQARISAAVAIRSTIPNCGWLMRALETDAVFIDREALIKEWK